MPFENTTVGWLGEDNMKELDARTWMNTKGLPEDSKIGVHVEQNLMNRGKQGAAR